MIWKLAQAQRRRIPQYRHVDDKRACLFPGEIIEVARILMQVCQEFQYEIHKLFTTIYVHRFILSVKLKFSPLYHTLYIRGGSRADFEDPVGSTL
jgi:hypothetical protein